MDVTSWLWIVALVVCHNGFMAVMAGSNSGPGSGILVQSPSSTTPAPTSKTSGPTSTTSAPTSTTTVTPTTISTTTTMKPSTLLTSVDAAASQATRSPFVIGQIFVDIYRGSKPDCDVMPCTTSSFFVGLARSAIHCATLCSQDLNCLYYRITDFTPTSRDVGYTSTSKLCYFYTLPPTLTFGSFKFLGQL